MNNLLQNEDKLLVSQLRNNKVKAFDALFYKYSNKLYRFSYSFLKNDEDAREIVQEAFYRIWHKRNIIDSTKSFKSFLFTISYNLIVDQLRLRLKDQEFRKFLQMYFDKNNLPEGSKIDYETISKQIEIAVNELPKKRKQIYQLSREHGLPHKKIAEQLGITVKTVENQISLSLKHIKSRLGTDILPVLFFIFLFA